jgi:GPH family glycoside/pentoside/hexuronide:cation symporter
MQEHPSAPPVRKLDLGTKLYYGFGSVAVGIKNNGYSYFVLFVYSQVLGLPGWMAGLALNIALVFDAILDPLVGYVSDRWRSRWGRRHPFLYASAIPISFMYFFLWNPPTGLTHLQLFLYLLLLSMVIRTAITCYETPSASLGPELSGDYVERSSLLSYRYFFGWFGGLTTYNLVWFLFAPGHVNAQYPDGRLNPDTWTIYGLVASVLMFIAILTTAIGTHRHIPYLIQPPPARAFDARKLLSELKQTLLSNRSYLYLFVSGMVAAVAAGIETAFSIYFDSYFWELTTHEMLIRGMCIYVSPIIGLILVPYFTDNLGKKNTVIGVWAFQTVFTIAPFVLRLVGWFPENHSPYLLPVLCAHVIINVSLIILVGATLSSMVFDLVEDIQRDTGRREEGLLFSARSFADKAVTGLGITIAGAILSIIQFPERAVPGAVDEATLAKLALYYVPLALGFYLIAVLLVRGYTLTRADHEKNLTVVATLPVKG